MLESLLNKVDSKDIKKAPTQVLRILQNFQEQLFHGTGPVAASAVLKQWYIPRKTSVTEA